MDGEGTFVISPIGTKYFTFIFQIVLHEDDINSLYTIQARLGFGKVSTQGQRNAAYYRVVAQADIQKIIDIFTSSPLNTSKHLAFLSFKKAFEIYQNAAVKSEVVEEVRGIIVNMNQKLASVIYSSPHISITPY